MAFEGDLGRISLINIPDLDEVVSRCRSQDIRGSRVKDDLSDFPTDFSADLASYI